MAKCATTHHACDCQIEWRKKAEKFLRDITWQSQQVGWRYSKLMMARARRLLGEGKPDA